MFKLLNKKAIKLHIFPFETDFIEYEEVQQYHILLLKQAIRIAYNYRCMAQGTCVFAPNKVESYHLQFLVRIRLSRSFYSS